MAKRKEKTITMTEKKYNRALANAYERGMLDSWNLVAPAYKEISDSNKSLRGSLREISSRVPMIL